MAMLAICLLTLRILRLFGRFYREVRHSAILDHLRTRVRSSGFPSKCLYAYVSCQPGTTGCGVRCGLNVNDHVWTTRRHSCSPNYSAFLHDYSRVLLVPEV